MLSGRWKRYTSAWPDQSADQMSPRRTRASRTRAAHDSASGQLHSSPASCASGYSRRSSMSPSPKPQPASRMRAPGGNGTIAARPRSAPAGVGKSGASDQLRTG